MARKNPLGKIKDTAFGTLRHPLGSAEKAVEHAKGTAAAGRMVAGQVARTAAEKASEGIEVVVTRAGRGRGRPVRTGLRPVPPVEEPAAAPVPDPGAPAAAAKKTAAKRTAAKKAPAKKAAAKKAPAKKAAVKKTSAKKAAKKAEVTPADVAQNVAKKTPQQASTTTPAKKAAKKAPAEKTSPGDRLPAKKTAAKKTAAKKTAAKKAPAKKTPAKKAPEAPRTAQQVADVEGPEVTTPVGTTAADAAKNPDTTETDLQQPGTEPLMDPATTKAVASEAETLQKAADPDKG